MSLATLIRNLAILGVAIPAQGAIGVLNETFSAGAGFTAGTTTVLTLANTYGSAANLWIEFDGVFQGPDTYTLVGVTLTFNAAIPLGTLKVYVKGITH